MMQKAKHAEAFCRKNDKSDRHMFIGQPCWFTCVRAAYYLREYTCTPAPAPATAAINKKMVLFFIMHAFVCFISLFIYILKLLITVIMYVSS